MIGGLAKTTSAVMLADPGSTGTTFVVYRAPQGQGKVTVTGASISAPNALSSGASNGRSFKLRKRGVDGQATAVDVATVGAAVAGTYPAWTANKPADFTVSGMSSSSDTSNILLPGEVLELQYTKAGTDTVGAPTLFVEIAAGVA